MENIFEIPNIGSDCNFWMLRTKAGWFYDEYIENEFIAIGWNSISKSVASNYLNDERLKTEIKKVYNEKLPGSALNKCRRFISEVKEGDIVLIAGRGKIAFAEVGEYCEIEKFSVKDEIDINKSIQNGEVGKLNSCPYNKRRNIKIISEITEEQNINPYLYKAMSGNMHSLSNLNDYAEIILSACYDIYMWKDNVSVTFRVEKESNINAFDFAEFVSNTAKLVSNEKEHDVAVKTSLHSPGDVILQALGFAKDNAILIAAVYFIVFGGKFKNYEFNSIFTCIKSFMERGHNKKIKELQLEEKGLQNDKLKQEIISLEIKNEKERYENQCRLIDETAPHIYEASKELNVTPRDGNIISDNKFKEMLDNA